MAGIFEHDFDGIENNLLPTATGALIMKQALSFLTKKIKHLTIGVLDKTQVFGRMDNHPKCQ